MISPEVLRRYPHFAQIPYESLRAIAALADERKFKAGERLLTERANADALMIISAGEVELVYDLPSGKESVVGTLVPGDLLAVSAVLEPYENTVNAKARSDGELIAIRAKELRQLCETDSEVGYRVMHHVAKALRSRLVDVRVQLVGMS